jgi:hypothetical protein
MNENPLRHLISFEGGAVALLATALDRYNAAEPSKNQLAFWANFAKQCELPLSNSGPSEVRLEYDGADLIVVWDSWLILIEAKISDKFIRHGQIQEYYQRFRPQLGRGGILDSASSMAVVFLTPSTSSQAAQLEFNKLIVGGDDRRLHLSWEMILPLLRNSFSMPQNEQIEFFSSLILRGVDRIVELLKDTTPGPMAVEWNPERRRCQDFAKDVQERVRQLWHGVHFNPIWSDKRADQICANFGSDHIGNLCLDVLPNSRIFEDNAEYSEFHGELVFKLAGRPSSDLKAKFNLVVKQNLKAFFRVKEIKIDFEGFTVRLPITLSENRSELCDQIAGLFCTCLIMFQPLMVSDNSKDAPQG